jgi:deoxyribodipyrimidine photo-lyase
MSTAPTIVWFRQDLRLKDNPALQAAIQRGGPVVPVFIWAPDEESAWPAGGATKWWLHRSLTKLAEALEAAGAPLIIREGASLQTLHALAKETGADALYWNRRYEPAIIARDKTIKESLRADGLAVESFNSALLFEPWTVQNKSKKPFQVFTPYWKHCLALPEPPAPLAAPRTLKGVTKSPRSLALSSLGFEPKIKWAEGMRAAWQPGEAGAAAALKRFCEHGFAGYSTNRNLPDVAGTSRLSPHLHFGEISPRQIWHGLKQHAEKNKIPHTVWHGGQFLAEVGWREFAYHLLYHFPHTPTQPLRAEFERFPGSENEEWLKAWQRGRTGYPLVDAGMRELWTTGWMHNRVRMVTASFLVKNLLIPWQDGARWFWDTLVDADLASNTLGWQWTAGCGADAAPFFRIFNPTTQSEKFDPQGSYIRRWAPELARLPDAWIHEPAGAPDHVLRQAGVELDRNYPRPIVSHAIAREVALAAYQRIKRG